MARGKTQEQVDQENFQAVLNTYKLELKLVYEKSQENFEKQLSYLSAGALGISILYIEDVLKDVSKIQVKYTLVISWILLTLTLVVNLLSHYLSSRNNFKSIQEIDDKNYSPTKVTKRIKQINFINIITIISFLLGILFLVTFVITNTMHEDIKHNGPDFERGLNPAPPPQLIHPKPQTGQNPTSPPNPPANPTPTR